MDRELLIEIGVEELPASWMPGLTVQLREKLKARLAELRLPALDEPESYSTPRRMVVRVGKIAERQEDLEETITGPPVSAAFDANGQPTPAALGFAKKQGVPFDQLGRAATPKGEYLAYQKRQRGRSAVDTLPDLMGALLRDLSFPKMMRWDARLEDGRGELLFGRPIRWLMFLYGGRVVPFTIGRAPGALGTQVQEIESGALTYGHRFLATSGRAGRSIKVRTFEDYQARLAEHFVILDHAERRDRIRRELEKHARRLGGRVQPREHAALIEEVADLVEYPGVVAGFFDHAFLSLPQEVLTTTLVHHQHYFPVVSDAGELKEAFLAVVNTQPADERRIAKNAERVVTARLRDAKFFWEADRKAPLESRLERLHTVVFHKKLGSYRDKANRIEKLAEWIAADVFARPGDAPHAALAARLAKADLTTDMVFEFPELQGTMGGIYAREEGQPEQVWKAIYSHYLPIGVEADAPPTREQLGAAAVTWAAVSLADKADTFVSLSEAGEKATGSRDPFGLRRQVQGIVRILMDLPELTGVDREVPLSPVFERVTDARGETLQGCLAFAAERVRFMLESRGYPVHVARAATSSGDLAPLRARRVAEALQAMRASEDFQALAVLFKRVKNIARELATEQHGPRFNTEQHGPRFNTEEHGPRFNTVQHGPRFNTDRHGSIAEEPDRSALVEPAERALLEELDARRPRIEAAVGRSDYRAALVEISGFRPAVDRFFTEVFVMVEDPRLRTARLALMAELRDIILRIADISEIIPKTE